MASHKPVPSKAALNALRGVVLTTSCSVILLAEERRRRLKIARTAIENARKLHTVKSHRGPNGLTEAFVAWDGRSVELRDDVLSFPTASSMNPYRRRRRTSISDPSSLSLSSLDHSLDLSGQKIKIDRPNYELSVIEVRNSLGLGSIDSMARQFRSRRRRKVTVHTKNRNTSSVTTLMGNSKDQSVSKESVNESQLVSKLKSLSLTAEDIKTKDSAAPLNGSELEPLIAARLFLCPPSKRSRDLRVAVGDVPVGFSRADGVAIVTDLLQDLDTDNVETHEVEERVELAIAVHRRLSLKRKSWKITTEEARAGTTLLQTCVLFLPGKLEAAIKVLLEGYSNVRVLMASFWQWLTIRHDHVNMQRVLHYLAQDHSRHWMLGSFVYQVLEQSTYTQSFSDYKALYQMLRAIDIFGKHSISPRIEYQIRCLMATRAFVHGDDDFASEEMLHLSRLEPKGTQTDIKLQGAHVVRQAELGRWEIVCARLNDLKLELGTVTPAFEIVLSNTTDAFAQNHSASQLENWIRRLVADLGLKINSRWVSPILDLHASRHDIVSTLSWLNFCGRHGSAIDGSVMAKICHSCRKYWSFSAKDVDRLCHSVESYLPSNNQPSRAKIEDEYKSLGQTSKPFSSSARGYTKLLSTTKTLARQGRWDEACAKYPTFSSSNIRSSASNLRLAVIERLRVDNGHTQGADALIQEARSRGEDVTEAITPLLLAQLERGADAEVLIATILAQGLRIHDSVYNKAAQALCGEGNLRAAASMCEKAAKENGDGYLLYNEYNFLNLVFAYTGSVRYKALKSLLNDFVSDIQWWHGSRTCKEGIKLAMKTTAMRAVTTPTERHSHQQTLDKLDEALIHVRDCRSTPSDRRAVTEAVVRLVIPTENTNTNRIQICEKRRAGVTAVNKVAFEPTLIEVRGQ